MIKAIFLDIDGTLVSFNTHKVPESAIEALHAVRRLGVKVIIATGRPRPFVDNLGRLEYDGLMTVNGASIRMADGLVLAHNPIPRADLDRLIAYYHANPFPIAFATDDETFITDTSPESVHILQLLNLPCPPVRPIESCLEMDVMQIIAFFTPEQEAHIMQNVLHGCSAQRWHSYFADVICAGNDKAHGIDVVAQHYGIDLSEVMAFGDGGNDLTMLRHVGYGIAMGNAREAVKEAARFVTKSVDENGIAEALKQFFPI